MRTVATRAPPFELDALARRIRASSNFRFESQFYAFDGFDPRSCEGMASMLDAIIRTPELHGFLRDSFVDVHARKFARKFAIEPVHEHCRIVDGNVESVLASVAGDHAGAYSRNLRAATAEEYREVEVLFAGIGDYLTFELVQGEAEGCATCRTKNHHLFTNWFHGVAWDWCLFVTWPKRKVMWMGCLTDTD